MAGARDGWAICQPVGCPGGSLPGRNRNEKWECQTSWIPILKYRVFIPKLYNSIRARYSCSGALEARASGTLEACASGTLKACASGTRGGRRPGVRGV